MTGKQTLLQKHRRVSVGRRWVAGACMLLALAACDRPRSGQTTAEGDEPHFRRGQKLISTNKPAALEAFQKVIDKRGGDAPESHLEVGRIYLDHFADYVAAIYHFRRYLDLKPNPTNATQVRQMIETAEKEYTRKLAGNPFEAQNDRLDLIEKIDRLEKEKLVLQTELDRLARSGRTVAANNPAPPTGTTSVRANQAGTVPMAPRVAPAPTPTTGWTNAIPESTPAPNIVPVLPDPASSASVAGSTQGGSGRVYLVQKGDTLVAISRKVYGSASHWKAVYEANRDRIPDPNALKIGTELRLP